MTTATEDKTTTDPVDPLKLTADEEKAAQEIVEDQQKQEAAAKEAGKTTEPTAEEKAASEEVAQLDKRWDEVKKVGVTPEELLHYAAKGWEHEKAAAESKPKGKGKKAASAEKTGESVPVGSGDDETEEEFVPVSKAELKHTADAIRNEIRAGFRGIQGRSELENLLNSADVTRENANSREIVHDRTLRLMAAGRPLRQAFNEAAAWEQEHLADGLRRGLKSKIAAGKAKGETTGSEPPTMEIPKFEHKPTDFDDGTAEDQAMEVMAQHEARFGRRG